MLLAIVLILNGFVYAEWKDKTPDQKAEIRANMDKRAYPFNMDEQYRTAGH